MASWRIRDVLLLSSALVTTGVVAGPAAAATGDRVAELLNPAAIAASACGRGGKNASVFKQGQTAAPVQLALASPAEAIAADQGPPL
jgi:hypothetical protein